MDNDRQKKIQDIMDSLVRLKRSLARGRGQKFTRHGVGMSHLGLLISMADSEDGITMSELTGVLGVTPAATSQFIDKLVRKGMVERIEDPHDRRVVHIRMTNRAKKGIEKMRKFYFERMEGRFANLNNQELGELAALLRKLDTGHIDKN